MTLRIEYLGFLPAIIVVGVFIYSFFDLVKKSPVFREDLKFWFFFTIVIIISSLGLAWGLSGI